MDSHSPTEEKKSNACFFFSLLLLAVGRQLPQPTQEEMQAMERRAAEVVKLLEDLREYIAAEGSNSAAMLAPKLEESRTAGFAAQVESGPGRAPKRPWEDVSGDEDNFITVSAYPQVSLRASGFDFEF